MVLIRLFLFTLIVLLVFSCKRMDYVERAYDTYDDAVRNDAIGEGRWLPALLPRSAKEIHETHNLDTNELWIYFQFEQKDYEKIVDRCTYVLDRDVAFPRQANSKWWPQSMSISNFEKKSQNNQQFVFYRCDKNWMAINRVTSQVYFWSLG